MTMGETRNIPQPGNNRPCCRWSSCVDVARDSRISLGGRS